MRKFCVKKTGVFYLLDALETLKGMNWKLEEMGEICCEDWTRMNADPTSTAEMKAQTAKKSLSRMKSIANVLAAISNSLDKSIRLVTRESSSFVQSVGFASLPDDLLARIFELCGISYCCEGELFNSNSFRFVMNLSSVCRRFRRITLHLPRLWQDAFDFQSKNWLLNIKGRCSNPFVYVPYRGLVDLPGLADFLKLLHPSSQWKGLHFSNSLRNAHYFFDQMSAVTGGKFDSLETLALKLGSEYEDGTLGDFTTTNVLDSDVTLLSTWRLSLLKRLTIANFIPPFMNLSNLQSCDIELCRHRGRIVWDLRALKAFLRCVHLVESLSLTFHSAYSPSDYRRADSSPIEFPRLASLDIDVELQTESKFLRDVMDMIDAVVLSKLKVSLDHDNKDGYELRSWFDAIFMFQTSPPQHRSFSKVTSFALHYPGRGESTPVPYDTILPTIPQLKHLHLHLFIDECFELQKVFEFCQDIRTIRLEMLPSDEDFPLILETLKNPKYKKHSEQLEKFEIVGFHNQPVEEKAMEELLGDRFVAS